jgi:peptide/nickel transport system substrate-binding protein/oligopeptide transport system substrate-binding protein
MVASGLALLGLATLLVAACGGTTNPHPTDLRNPQVFKMLWPGSTNNEILSVGALDPGTAGDTSTVPIVDLVWDGLVTLDPHLNVELWGADHITVSADGLTYTFHLRAGQRFSDGQPVKASDYAWSMDRVLNPCFASVTNYYLWTIQGAQAFSNEGCSNGTPTGVQTLVGTSLIPDDGAATLTVTLAKPAGYFLQALTYPTSYALERSVVSGANLGADDVWTSALTQGSTGQGGSGMFYVSRKDSAGNIILKANPYWWGRSQGKTPYLTEVDFQLFSDPTVMYLAYDTGPAHDYVQASGSFLAEAKHQPDYHQVGGLTIEGVALNWKLPPFNNLDARLAFCEALNRDAITNNVLKGGQMPSWHLVPQGMAGYNPQLTGPDNITSTQGDLTKAQAHWAAYKASLNGAPLPKIAYTFGIKNNYSLTYTQALATSWNQPFPDAHVTTNLVSPQEYFNALNARNVLQLFYFSWAADYPDPQDFLTQLFDTPSPFNYWNDSVPQADQLMEQADSLTDQTQRIQRYNQAEQLLVNNVAVCPTDQFVETYRVRTAVHGYVENAQGINANDNWASMYITNS